MFSIPRIQDLNGMIHRRSTFVVYCGPWILHILVSIIPCLESFRRLSIFPHGNFAWMASAEILKVLDFEIVPPESISAHHWQLSEAYTNGKPCYVCVLGGCFHHNATWGTYSLRSFPETLTLAKREEECDNSCFFFNSTTKHSFGHRLSGSHRSYIKNMDSHFACSSSVICCKPGPSAGP